MLSDWNGYADSPFKGYGLSKVANNKGYTQRLDKAAKKRLGRLKVCNNAFDEHHQDIYSGRESLGVVQYFEQLYKQGTKRKRDNGHVSLSTLESLVIARNKLRRTNASATNNPN